MQLGFFSMPNLSSAFSSVNWSSLLKTAAPAALQLAQVKQNIDTQKAVAALQQQQQAAIAAQQAAQLALQAGYAVPSIAPQVGGRATAQPVTRAGGREQRAWVLPAALAAGAVGVAVLFSLTRSK